MCIIHFTYALNIFIIINTVYFNIDNHSTFFRKWLQIYFNYSIIILYIKRQQQMLLFFLAGLKNKAKNLSENKFEGTKNITI